MIQRLSSVQWLEFHITTLPASDIAASELCSSSKTRGTTQQQSSQTYVAAYANCAPSWRAEGGYLNAAPKLAIAIVWHMCGTSTGTHNNAKARIKRPMQRPTGEQDTRDRQNSGYCDGQLEVERRIREDQSNADSMPRPPIRAQVTPG